MPAVLLVLSCVVLTLEVLETKIFAYCLANNLIFVVVGLALLGFGAGGTALSLRRELGDPRRLVRNNLFLSAALVVIAHAYFAQVSPSLRFAADLSTVSALVLLASPYFSAGMAIAAILADPRGNVPRRYSVNLVGSALGCASVFAWLGPLTAPQCLVACAAVLGLLGACLCRRQALAAGAVLAASAALFAFADAVFPYRPEPADSGQLSLLAKNVAALRAEPKVLRAELVPRFDRWDPTARVQVHEPVLETSDPEWQRQLAELPSMWFTQDSSFGSPLVGVGPKTAAFLERTCYGAGYFRGRRAQDVLVIGLGGAPDVQAALHHGARSVTGVDINRATAALVRGPFRDYLGAPYADPRVAIHIQDGRSFVRGDDGLYDHIQLSGVDTKSLLAAGTLAINESYLYTRQAFADYLRHLRPDGLLCLVYAAKTKMRRLAVTALAALRDLGAAEPHRHVMLLAQSEIVMVLVKRTPFTEAECRQLEAWVAACDQGDGKTGVVLMVYELLVPGGALSLQPVPQALYVPGRPTAEPLMQAAAAGRLDDFVRGYRDDATGEDHIAPVDDDRPFFFHCFRRDTVLRQPPAHFQRLYALMRIMVVLAAVLILAPLVAFKLRGLRILRNLPFALYFAALGLGFILAEIGLIQRYVLFLGHQAFAFPTVIGGLLVAAGLGSAWSSSSRLRRRPHAVIGGAVAAAGAAIAAHQLLLDGLFGLASPLPLAGRIGVAFAALLPLGVPLGMLFPTGLVLVQRASPLFVPWAFGINGVFSVIGSTAVMPGAILYGFPAMAGAAAGVYLLAALVGVPLAWRALRAQ